MLISNGFVGMRDNDANMRLNYGCLIWFPDFPAKLGVVNE